MSKRFIKRPEDFTCFHCGFKVKGSGYTDHCPNCLWSRHVDIYPGDRRSPCGGEMKPIDVLIKNGQYYIYYQCQKCGLKRRYRAALNDNIEVIIQISKHL